MLPRAAGWYDWRKVGLIRVSAGSPPFSWILVITAAPLRRNVTDAGAATSHGGAGLEQSGSMVMMTEGTRCGHPL
jgi:hypothetical protein